MEIRNTLGLFAPLALLAQAPAATAQDTPIVLEPSSQWVVDFQADRCIVMRAFGEGEQKTVLQFSQFIPLEGISVTLTGSLAQVRPKLEPNTMLVMNLGPGDRPAYSSFGIGKTAEGEPALMANAMTLGTPPKAPIRFMGRKSKVDKDEPEQLLNAELDFAADVDAIGFDSAVARPFTLKTGPLDKLFGVMRKCTDDLVDGLGIDPVAMRARQKGPEVEMKSMMGVANAIQRNYPDNPAAKRSARIITRLLLDEKGRVTGCELMGVTDSDGYGGGVCRTVDNLRFEPAIDALGKPMKSVTMQTITYYAP